METISLILAALGFLLVLAVTFEARALHRRANQLRLEAEDLEQRVKRLAELLRKTQPPQQ